MEKELDNLTFLVNFKKIMYFLFFVAWYNLIIVTIIGFIIIIVLVFIIVSIKNLILICIYIYIIVKNIMKIKKRKKYESDISFNFLIKSRKNEIIKKYLKKCKIYFLMKLILHVLYVLNLNRSIKKIKRLIIKNMDKFFRNFKLLKFLIIKFLKKNKYKAILIVFTIIVIYLYIIDKIIFLIYLEYLGILLKKYKLSLVFFLFISYEINKGSNYKQKTIIFKYIVQFFEYIKDNKNLIKIKIILSNDYGFLIKLIERCKIMKENEVINYLKSKINLIEKPKYFGFSKFIFKLIMLLGEAKQENMLFNIYILGLEFNNFTIFFMILFLTLSLIIRLVNKAYIIKKEKVFLIEPNYIELNNDLNKSNNLFDLFKSLFKNVKYIWSSRTFYRCLFIFNKNKQTIEIFNKWFHIDYSIVKYDFILSKIINNIKLNNIVKKGKNKHQFNYNFYTLDKSSFYEDLNFMFFFKSDIQKVYFKYILNIWFNYDEKNIKLKKIKLSLKNRKKLIKYLILQNVILEKYIEKNKTKKKDIKAHTKKI
jgi:hypothetical protein